MNIKANNKKVEKEKKSKLNTLSYQKKKRLTAIQKALLTRDQIGPILNDLATKLKLNQNSLEDLQAGLQESNRSKDDLLQRYIQIKNYLKYGLIFVIIAHLIMIIMLLTLIALIVMMMLKSK
jgi:hypothetical protein